MFGTLVFWVRLWPSNLPVQLVYTRSTSTKGLGASGLFLRHFPPCSLQRVCSICLLVQVTQFYFPDITMKPLSLRHTNAENGVRKSPSKGIAFVNVNPLTSTCICSFVLHVDTRFGAPDSVMFINVLLFVVRYPTYPGGGLWQCA